MPAVISVLLLILQLLYIIYNFYVCYLLTLGFRDHTASVVDKLIK